MKDKKGYFLANWVIELFEITTLTTPTFFDFKSFLLPDYTRFWAYQKIFPKEIEEN